MFLPMSCTSPRTVASITGPFCAVRPPEAARRARMRENADFAASAHRRSCGRYSVFASNRCPASFKAGTMAPSTRESGACVAKRASAIRSAAADIPLQTTFFKSSIVAESAFTSDMPPSEEFSASADRYVLHVLSMPLSA